ncbi:MAG: cation diffusion facilitator family transporter, partial [Chthoniobacterales bacterium]
LIAGLAFILWQAAQRLVSPEPVNAPGMMILAVVGIVVNGAAVLRVKKGTSLTEKVVSWHLLEDTLGWGAVLLGAGIMAIWDVPIIDPLLSIGISLFVLWNVGRNLTRVMKVFLQTAPASFSVEKFREEVGKFPKVERTHHVHVWSLDGESHVLSMHLQMTSDASRAEIVEAKNKVREALDEETFEHVTIDVELASEDCAAPDESAS